MLSPDMLVSQSNALVRGLGPTLKANMMLCSSVMEDNTEDSKYVLTQGKNNPEDWVARGANFMDNKLYDHAAHCYRVAEDDVRRTVALAYARFSSLVRKKSRMTPSEYRLEYRQATFKVSKLQLLICD